MNIHFPLLHCVAGLQPRNVFSNSLRSVLQNDLLQTAKIPSSTVFRQKSAIFTLQIALKAVTLAEAIDQK